MDTKRTRVDPEVAGTTPAERVSALLKRLTAEPEYREAYRGFIAAMCYGTEDETPTFGPLCRFRPTIERAPELKSRRAPATSRSRRTRPVPALRRRGRFRCRLPRQRRFGGRTQGCRDYRRGPGRGRGSGRSNLTATPRLQSDAGFRPGPTSQVDHPICGAFVGSGGKARAGTRPIRLIRTFRLFRILFPRLFREGKEPNRVHPDANGPPVFKRRKNACPRVVQGNWRSLPGRRVRSPRGSPNPAKRQRSSCRRLRCGI